jgi:hypothetical protein
MHSLRIGLIATMAAMGAASAQELAVDMHAITPQGIGSSIGTVQIASTGLQRRSAQDCHRKHAVHDGRSADAGSAERLAAEKLGNLRQFWGRSHDCSHSHARICHNVRRCGLARCRRSGIRPTMATTAALR